MLVVVRFLFWTISVVPVDRPKHGIRWSTAGLVVGVAAVQRAGLDCRGLSTVIDTLSAKTAVLV